MKGEIDLIRIFDAFVHGVRLPPSGIVIIIMISEEGSWVIATPTNFAWLLLYTRLLAEFDRMVLAACVGCLHQNVKSRVFERRYASLKYAQYIMYNI